MIKGATLLSFL